MTPFTPQQQIEVSDNESTWYIAVFIGYDGDRIVARRGRSKYYGGWKFAREIQIKNI